MKNLLFRLWPITAALGLAALLVGCKSNDSDLTERPWNAPKSWETGLPSGLTEGR